MQHVQFAKSSGSLATAVLSIPVSLGFSSEGTHGRT
jgi:hypothetical protein